MVRVRLVVHGARDENSSRRASITSICLVPHRRLVKALTEDHTYRAYTALVFTAIE